MIIINKTKKLSLSAILASIGVCIMYLGSVLDVFDLTSAAIASLCVYFAVIEIGGLYPWGIWFTVSVLSLILLPTKFGALCFSLFVGIYPMFKLLFERKKYYIGWMLKLSMFGTAAIVISLVMKYIFVGEYEGFELQSVRLIFIVLALVTFVLYDIAMTKLLILYTVKLRSKLKVDKLLRKK